MEQEFQLVGQTPDELLGLDKQDKVMLSNLKNMAEAALSKDKKMDKDMAVFISSIILATAHIWERKYSITDVDYEIQDEKNKG